MAYFRFLLFPIRTTHERNWRRLPKCSVRRSAEETIRLDQSLYLREQSIPRPQDALRRSMYRHALRPEGLSLAAPSAQRPGRTCTDKCNCDRLEYATSTLPCARFNKCLRDGLCDARYQSERSGKSSQREPKRFLMCPRRASANHLSNRSPASFATSSTRSPGITKFFPAFSHPPSA